ncbi:putative porin [Methylicorpusculum sp.]|uniref:putative porin n=1 Tax=Methylicorpusculum sp. TaxID=2713644 RepID=UPI002736670A|nr:putative porin [Methylicorpusculum sp.]MDP3529386.1 putative porin [Methylicorpusculum sp.]MDZ4150020.1 putative porin [Methylicorpusculum sp.]
MNRAPYNTMTIVKKSALFVLASSLFTPVMADEKDELLKLKSKMAAEKEELLKLKNTTVNLMDLLVEEGVLDKKKTESLIRAAEQKAAVEAKQQIARETSEELDTTEPDKAAPAMPAKQNGSVYVGYVPEFVKEEIRQQVRADLKDEVVQEVKADAKEELWGIPAALPDWVSRLHFTFDSRFRFVNDFFDSENAPYLDYLSINSNGGNLAAFNRNEEFLNNTKDELRLSQRFRAGLNLDITDGVKAGVRVGTSNIRNPVSNEQTLGNTGESFEFVVDRAFIQYDFIDQQGKDWFTFYAGRFANPWLSTDVVYDPDLSFQGFAGTFRYRFNQDSVNVRSYRAAMTNDLGGRAGVNFGPQTPDSVFATLGIFPIQEINLSVKDKWLLGGQLGADWLVYGQNRLKVGAAYYHYRNTRARANTRNSFEYDWTAPEFIQKGNTMVPININEGNDLAGNPFNSRCTDATTRLPGDACLWGLASDFNIFNATMIYDYSGFDPVHVMLTLDYAKNLGYDESRIRKEFGDRLDQDKSYAGKTNAFQVRLDVGDQDVVKFNDWNLFWAYRYIQRDAVLDAFTESLFHGGGTDAKGWWLGANYGLAKNTWVNLRWSSSDAIDGPPLSIDTGAVDLNVRF